LNAILFVVGPFTATKFDVAGRVNATLFVVGLLTATKFDVDGFVNATLFVVGHLTATRVGGVIVNVTAFINSKALSSFPNLPKSMTSTANLDIPSA